VSTRPNRHAPDGGAASAATPGEERPRPWSVTATTPLWTEPHLAEQLLAAHLDPDVDAASRRGAFIDRSVRWIVEAFGLGPGARVLDLGCGPGLYTTRLAATGATVTGIDLSPRSIRHARETADRGGVQVTHLVGDYLEALPPGPFDLVTLIYNDLGALRPTARARLLALVADRLAPGGSFLADVDSLARFATVEELEVEEVAPTGGFWSPRPHVVRQRRFRYDDLALALDRYVITEPDRRWTVHVWCQHFEPDGLAAELETAGLAVTQVLGDVAGAPYDPDGPQFAVVATAPCRPRTVVAP
jgi:SAM-dependent methyltransferase